LDFVSAMEACTNENESLYSGHQEIRQRSTNDFSQITKIFRIWQYTILKSSIMTQTTIGKKSFKNWMQ
jgi:hypothetical protein